MLNYRKKAIIAQVIQDMSAKNYFTESEIEELYNLSVECKNNFLSQDESITKINNFPFCINYSNSCLQKYVKKL